MIATQNWTFYCLLLDVQWWECKIFLICDLWLWSWSCVSYSFLEGPLEKVVLIIVMWFQKEMSFFPQLSSARFPRYPHSCLIFLPSLRNLCSVSSTLITSLPDAKSQVTCYSIPPTPPLSLSTEIFWTSGYKKFTAENAESWNATSTVISSELFVSSYFQLSTWHFSIIICIQGVPIRKDTDFETTSFIGQYLNMGYLKSNDQNKLH